MCLQLPPPSFKYVFWWLEHLCEIWSDWLTSELYCYHPRQRRSGERVSFLSDRSEWNHIWDVVFHHDERHTRTVACCAWHTARSGSHIIIFLNTIKVWWYKSMFKTESQLFTHFSTINVRIITQARRKLILCAAVFCEYVSFFRLTTGELDLKVLC